MILILSLSVASWSAESSVVSDASPESASAARSRYEAGMDRLAKGDRWRACAELAAAWQIGRMPEARDPETALLAAGPYCQLLFDFSLLDPLWWVADEALTLQGEVENPSPEVTRSIGWAHYWVLMHDRVTKDLDTAHEHADEALRIAGEVDDATLRAWTRLERSRLYSEAGDSVSAEVEILRCRAEPLYRADIDFRSQCELRMEEAHLAAERYDQAARVVEVFLEGRDVSPNYRTEALYLLGSAYRSAGETVRAVGPLCLGSWLHPEHGDWRYQCMIGRDRLFEGKSSAEGLQLLDMGRALGPTDATAATALETISRYPNTPQADEARAWIAAATEGGLLPSAWDALVRYRIQIGPRDAESVTAAYQGLIQRCPGDYPRMDGLVAEGMGKMGGIGGPDGAAAFLETVRPLLPACLYLSQRMQFLWNKGDHAAAVETAREFIKAIPEPKLYEEYHWLRIYMPYYHETAHFFVIMSALEADDFDGVQAAIGDLLAESPDPVIVQRGLARVVENPLLARKPELAVRFLDQVLAIRHSPVQKERLLLRKAWLLRDLSRDGEAQRVYQDVMSGTAYLEGGGIYVGRAYLDLAHSLQNKGRRDEAVSLYQTMIARKDELGEPSATAFVELARLYRSMGRSRDAADVVDVGLGWVDGTGFTHAHYYLLLLRGRVLADLGNREAAVEVFRDLAGEGWPDWVRNEARQWLEQHGLAAP